MRVESGTLARGATPSYYQSFTLDALGNWSSFNDNGTSQDREFDAANQITEISGQAGWVTPEYDDAGNMIFGPMAGNETTKLHFKYDAWNRLVKVTDDSQTPVTIAEYRYDGQGRRIAKAVGETTTHYFFNESWQVLETRVGADPDPLDQFVWDARYVDAPVVRFHDANTDGDYLDTGDNVLYYCQDANWNVTALVDAATGNVVERCLYDPYGKATVLDGDWQLVSGNASAFANEILYAGYRLDAESGMFQVRNRNYHPTLGRWIERDPAGYVDGMSLYQYCRSNPAAMTDPQGTIGGDLPVVLQRYGTDLARSGDANFNRGGNYLDAGETAKGLGYRAAGTGQLIGGFALKMIGGGLDYIDPLRRNDRYQADRNADVSRGVDPGEASSTAFIKNMPVHDLFWSGFEGIDGQCHGGVEDGRVLDLKERIFKILPVATLFFGEGLSLLERPSGAATRLVHLTDAEGGAGIDATKTLIGDNYAGPLSNANETGFGVTLRTGLLPDSYKAAVPIPEEALSAFSSPIPIGPLTALQRATGVQYTANGTLNLLTGEFTRTGVNMIQAEIYALDATMTGLAGTAGVLLYNNYATDAALRSGTPAQAQGLLGIDGSIRDEGPQADNYEEYDD